MTRRKIVTLFAVAVGLLHVVTGPGYAGPLRPFVTGYLIDILLPCAIFLVLGVGTKLSAARRGLLVFGAGAVTETLQLAGIPVFGRTFDVLDFGMFLVGVSIGWIVEARLIARWSP